MSKYKYAHSPFQFLASYIKSTHDIPTTITPLGRNQKQAEQHA
jgi:hypothetical protein